MDIPVPITIFTMTMRLLTSLLSLYFTVSAFVVVPNQQQQQRKHPSFYGHAHLEEMEEARRHFESMIGPLLFTAEETVPLTNGGRQRRKLEINLLKSLKDGDEAINELMSLWIHECPCKVVSTDAVKFMEFDCTSIAAAEETLRNILADCPIRTWPEPAARLALLLFVQGRYAECQEYTDAVIVAKPWHFEALQMQVLLQLVLHRDYAAAVSAARAGLPPLSQPRKRAAWIETAVSQATDQLDAMELQTARLAAKQQQQPLPSATAWQ
jgi:hypothetical protein